MSDMTLRKVCNAFGVSSRAVQGYEAAGLVLIKSLMDAPEDSWKARLGKCVKELERKRGRLKRQLIVTIHGTLHPAAGHPANKAVVSSIQPLAEGDLEWAGCVTVCGRVAVNCNN